MYGVRQTYYDTGKIAVRMVWPDEVEHFLKHEATKYERHSDTSYYHSYKIADIYIDLFKTEEQAKKFYEETLIA